MSSAALGATDVLLEKQRAYRPPLATLQDLLPAYLQCGLAGWVRVGTRDAPFAFMNGAPSRGTTVWQDADFGVCARGEAHHLSSPSGWDVFAFGGAHVAALAATVLEKSFRDGDAAPGALDGKSARDLCWGLLPTAAVIAWNRARGTVCLLRDGLGFHPLFYTFADGCLVFSTNAGALATYRRATGINTDKVSEMLAFGQRSGSRTLWQGIDVVAPGQMVCCRRGARPALQWFWQPQNLFDLAERQRLERLSEQQLVEEVRDALHEAVEPVKKLAGVGVPCGGGVDSSLLGAFLHKQSIPVTFYCINQPDAPLREADWIAPLSRRLHVPCAYTELTRNLFLETFVDSLCHGNQPASGPNFMGGYALRRQALAQGESDFVIGQLCDTLLGGMSKFTYLSPRFRLLRLLARLPRRLRVWLTRGLADESAWLFSTMQVGQPSDLAAIGAGDLGRAETSARTQGFSYPGQSITQRMADQLAWLLLVDVPSADLPGFYEADERYGGTTHLPFAHPRLARLGFHLPHFWKRRAGHNKWLWRQFAAGYVGHEVAFREKQAFPTLSSRWLDRAWGLLPGGFVENLFRVRVERLDQRLGNRAAAEWALTSIEVWGRINCWGEEPAAILEEIR